MAATAVKVVPHIWPLFPFIFSQILVLANSHLPIQLIKLRTGRAKVNETRSEKSAIHELTIGECS